MERGGQQNALPRHVQSSRVRSRVGSAILQTPCPGFPPTTLPVPIAAMLPWIPLVAGFLCAQGTSSPWKESAGSRGFERVTSVPERDYGALRIDGALLLRERDGERSVLDCLDGELPGELRELAADPGGLTFLAAENGLYVTSPEVRVVDRLELSDGAPPGSPTSVHVDARRRVWIATDRAFGCLDPSFYFGRTIEVPGTAPYRLRSEGDLLLVESADGVHAYSPDAGPPPTVDGLELDGAPLERDAALTIGFGDSIPLRATGTAQGEPVFRYRVDRHHVWLALEDGVDVEIEPGAHLLEVVAVDRDLRYSEPFPLRVVIDYPFYYRKRFVVGLASLVTAMLAGLFWRTSAAVAPARKRLRRTLVSTALVIVLALQVLAGLVPHGRGWPFIGYSMYTESLDVGHVSYNAVLIGLTADGSRLRIDPGALGVAADNRWQVLGPLIRGGAEVNRKALEKLNADRPTWPPIVRLQVWAERWLLTEDGPLPIAQLVLSDYRAEAAE